MRKLIRTAALLLCLLLGAASGCAQAVTFTDALGQVITVDNPRRVVALMGSFAEVWLLAGGADTLVGTAVDTTDHRDLGIGEHVVSVGTYQNPNLEAILSLNPDLVLLSGDTVRTGSHVALRDSLAAAGIPAAYFKVTHFEDYLAMLDICTQITGNRQAYEQNGAQVQAQIEQILSGNAAESGPSVLLMITYSGGIRPQGADTMTGRMLAQLGWRNILDAYPSLLREFSIEKVIEIDPDYILVIPMGNDDEALRRNLQKSVQSNPAWNGLSAVIHDRCILLPGEKFVYKPNARWAESYAYLSGLTADSKDK